MSSKKRINCSACTEYWCKEIAQTGGFKYWGCMLKYIHNDHKPQSLLFAMEEGIREFVSEYEFYWSGGVFLCKTPCGAYIWNFAVMMKQEKMWSYREFTEGWDYGYSSKKPSRGANPYQEPARNSSWDCGYILGLHEKKKE